MNWHRIFGLTLADFFTGTRYTVELEKDLSLQQQFVDVVVIEQTEGAPVEELPDGLDNLGPHNLATYKSFHQPLDAWTLDELLGHYVNYRKQESVKLDPQKLLPEEDFRLYAICTREPTKLAGQTELRPLREGVYEVLWGSQSIRVIVLSQVPKHPRNAVWQLFSNVREGVHFGAANYLWRSSKHSLVVNDLYHYYQAEVPSMPYTWDDYYDEKALEHKDKILARLPVEDRLKGVKPAELLKRVPVADRLQGVKPAELLKRVPVADRLQGLKPADLLKHLPPEEIEAYLKKLRKRPRKK